MSGPAAIILAAGAGSRLRSVAPVKPLVDVGGRPLIAHALAAMQAGGAARAVVVLGYRAEAIEAAAASAASGAGLPVDFVHNPHWETTPNGVSLLAARAHIGPGSLLMMADHLLSPQLVRRLVEGAALPLALGVDRRLGHPHVDEADVTRVRTGDGRIRAIGKHLAVYDCYDTGLFRIGPELVSALDSLRSPGLSDGVSILAGAGLAQAVDIGDAPWLDVDDARALKLARDEWRAA
ncbi:NTP transferase domain-containing protein [Sandaracinobacter sp. RS1-74]|uniref:phosphocholine cytidylyltransferase family protein n=1 Tax=Sandaracinobacteroides sayramensis TaxID=2913411 RepID=UPI001EDBA103|nr:NTP transferase domain-containing protein [Sandaracinobacteroides sayramensis]